MLLALHFPLHTSTQASLMLGAVVWSPVVGVWTLTLLLVAATLVVRRSGRLLAVRCGRWRGRLLTVLRVLVLSALFLALLDPACERRVRRVERRTVLVAVDRSGSMRVPDRGANAAVRLARAVALAERIEQRLPEGFRVVRYAVGAELTRVTTWEELSAPTATSDVPEGTDLAAVLLQASALPDGQDAAALVLLTDGGDSAIAPAKMPSAPLTVVGIGGDPATWRDVAVRTVTAPERVEVASRVRVEAALTARTAGDAAFTARLGELRAVLERQDGVRWVPLGETRVDLRKGTAVAAFDTVAGEPGPQRWRVRVDGVAGELSELNNLRQFQVSVVRESLKVLYFSRRLGMDLKFVRQELSSDPSVSFSTLLQTAGSKFLLQGEAQAWEGLAEMSGLPPLAVLKRFDAVVVGSFPATEWRLEEIEALRRFVEEGGGLVWVGGEHSFDAAHAALPLAELIPWHIGTDDRFIRTAGSVLPTADGVNATATAGLWEMLRADATDGNAPALEVQAVNTTGALKAGATALLAVRTPDGTTPLLVEQPYGRGRIFALTSNTTWRWVTAGPPLDRLYRRLWRQTVRAACGEGEDAGVLRVRVERDVFLPGERVGLDVEVLADAAQYAVTAKLEGRDGVEVLGLERDAASPARWHGAFVCRMRGRHVLSVQAMRSAGATETWERVFDVAPLESEGSRLELDEDDLGRLAKRGAGEYLREDDTELPERLAARFEPRTQVETVSLVSSGPWYLLAVLVLLCVEWTLRRRRNLV